MKLLLLAVLAAAPLDHSLLESSGDTINITTDHSLLPAPSAPRSPASEVSKPPAEIVADVFVRYSDAIQHTTDTGEVVPVVLYRQGNRNDEALVREHLQLVSAAGINTQAPFLLHDVTANDSRSRTLTDFFEAWTESDQLPRLSSLWRETDNGRTSVTGGGDLVLPATVDQFAGFVARQSRRSRSRLRRRSVTSERVIESSPIIERQRSVRRERVIQPAPVIERTRERSRSSRRTLRLNRIQAPSAQRERLSERQRIDDSDLPCSTADCRASSRYTESSSGGYYYTNRRGVLGLLRRRR